MRCWVGVAVREHVRRGVAGGFCQLGHGKHEPVKRLKPGDRIVYYSAKETMAEGSPPMRAFTAIGEIADRDAYQAEMAPGFTPWRRDVRWFEAAEAPIGPLLPELSFIPDKARWGFPFRRGSFTIPEADFRRIAAAMGARLPDA